MIVDIYFEENYGKLYEKMEKGNSILFEYKTNLGHIRHLFIKREIPTKINGKTWYDLVTPYGYGGPIILNVGTQGVDELVNEYEKEFQKYCEENFIVSEFVRFHPIYNNESDFQNIYSIKYKRKTLGTKISKNSNYFMDEFSKSARKTIRKALKEGLDYNVIEKPENYSNFLEIYYSTMKRNLADGYYYFDESYFRNCLKLFKNNTLIVEVMYENKVIASALYFVYGDIIHAHLSGTLTKFLKLSPAYIIKYATAEWAKENGIKLIHYGGGITNDLDDTLYKFKRKFSKETEFDFYTGEKIWNTHVYNLLCKMNYQADDKDFFPAYRS